MHAVWECGNYGERDWYRIVYVHVVALLGCCFVYLFVYCVGCLIGLVLQFAYSGVVIISNVPYS